ncbi:MAG: GNAT family N-acetyltransferase [Clostridia bacterium]|nr:GNAT family N-acetyltransferase [Clostridia bacterium]
MKTESERLILREFSPDDFDDVQEYSSDYETVKHMMFGPNTPEQTREYLEQQCAEEMKAVPRMHYNLAMELKETGRVIGGISFHMNWRRDDAILGAIINRRYNGKGYMTEGLKALLDLAFDTLKMHRVHGVVDVENIAMQRVFEKCGMRNEGRMIQRGKARPEAEKPYFDQFGYAILADEWHMRRAAERAEKRSD